MRVDQFFGSCRQVAGSMSHLTENNVSILWVCFRQHWLSQKRNLERNQGSHQMLLSWIRSVLPVQHVLGVVWDFRSCQVSFFGDEQLEHVGWHQREQVPQQLYHQALCHRRQADAHQLIGRSRQDGATTADRHDDNRHCLLHPGGRGIDREVGLRLREPAHCHRRQPGPLSRLFLLFQLNVFDQILLQNERCIMGSD